MSNHFKISIVKSAIRILGALDTTIRKNIKILALSILVAELVGILEEVFENE